MKYTAKDNFIKIGRAFRGDDNFDEPRTREEWHNLIGSVIPDADFDEWFEESRPRTFSEWFAQHPTSEAVDTNEMLDEDLDLYVADYVQEKIAEAAPAPAPTPTPTPTPRTKLSFSEWYAETTSTGFALDYLSTDELEHLAEVWLIERIGL